MKIYFTEIAWNDYIYWQNQDKKTIKRINQLIQDIDRNNNEGTGKPEALKGNLSGWWSRRIDDKNRLVYRIQDNIIEISQCKGHYDDK
ncbi:MAG: Txe/YoeB family addiction module toxin [Syntrophomonas sp.]